MSNDTKIESEIVDVDAELIDPATGQYKSEMLDVFEPPKVKKDAGKQAKVSSVKSDLKLWTPRKMPMQLDWMPLTREKLARKRIETGDIREVFGNTFHVNGNSGLSDKYDKYIVKRLPESNRWSCSCQGHAYGDTRTLCSHALAVALTLYEPDQITIGEFGSLNPVAAEPELVEVVCDENLNPPTDTHGIGDKLVDLAEQFNRVGMALVMDEWKIAIPKVWELTWTRSDKVGLVRAETGLIRPAFDPDLLTPEERAESKELTSQEIIDEWRYRQTVMERLNSLTEMPAPSHWHLPDHFTSLREAQWLALKQIIGAWASGKKFVFVDAPTGAGKSIIANIAFLEWAQIPYGKEQQKGLLVVTSKDLQDQMNSDFGKQWWFAMIKGRLNYPTANFPERFMRGNPDAVMVEAGNEEERMNYQAWQQHIDCSDCEFAQKKHCRYCDPKGVTGPAEGGGAPCLGRCPYRKALWKVIKRPLGLLNTAYLLRSCNSFAWQNFDDRSVLMIDEADTLESVMMGYITVEIPEKRLNVLGLKVGRPVYKTHGVEATTDWWSWAGRAKERIAEIVARRKSQLKGDTPLDGSWPGEDKIRQTADNRDLRRDLKYWEQLADSIQTLMDSLGNGDVWVYDGYQINKEDGTEFGPIIFKPVKIDKFTHPKLFKHFKNVCFLSATTISADQEARNLGLDSNDYAVISIPRTFDPTRCPIYAMPVADNSAKAHDESWPLLVDACKRILIQNLEHRCMIHAVSYKQADRIYHELRKLFPGRAILTHTRDSGNKKHILERYAKTPGAVLISPSMARGADFKDDLCRVQIILKVPFGYLGDKQISARLYGTPDGRLWYQLNAIRELVQMTGRNMRSELDWGVNYILDKQFFNVWGNYAEFFPEWWRQSLHIMRPGDF